MENGNNGIIRHPSLRFCSVKSCRSTSQNMKMFTLPRQLSQQQLWLEFLKPHCKPIKRPEEKRRLYLSVCILHFEDKFFLPDGRRHKFAFPTLFTEEEIRTKQPQHTYSICTENVVDCIEHFDQSLTTSEEYKFRRGHIDHTYCMSTIVKLVVGKTNPEAASQPDKSCKNNGQTQTDDTPLVDNGVPVSASQESQTPSRSVGEFFANFDCNLANKETSTVNPYTTQDSATYIPCEDTARVSEETEFLNETFYDESLELTSNDEMNPLNEKLDDEILKPINNEKTLGDKNLELTKNEKIEYLDGTLDNENLELTINEKIEFYEILDGENVKLTSNTEISDENLELSNNESFDVANDDFIIIIPSKAHTVDIPSQVSLEISELREYKSKHTIYTSDIAQQSEYENKQVIYASAIPQVIICKNKETINTSSIPQHTECENKQVIYTPALPQQTSCENRQTIHTSGIFQQTGCQNKSDIITLNKPQQPGCENKPDIITLNLPPQTRYNNKQTMHTLNLPQTTGCDNRQAMHNFNLPQQTGYDNKQAMHTLNLPKRSACDDKQAKHTLILPKQTGYDDKQAMHALNVSQQTEFNNKQAIHTLFLPKQTECDKKQTMHTLTLPKQTGCDTKQVMRTLSLPQIAGCDNKQVFYTVVFSEPIKSIILPQMSNDDEPNIDRTIQQSEEEHSNVHIDIPNVIQSIASNVELHTQQELNETETNNGSWHEDRSLTSEENNENVDQNLIQTCKLILNEGLKKDVKEKLLQQYQISDSCIPLITPTLNPIVMAVASKKVKNREKYLQSKQDQLGVGIAAINKAFECILQNDIQKTVQVLYDSCLILSDLHYTGTRERKQLIAPALKKKFALLFRNQETEDTNFKDELVNKAKSELKANTKKRQKLDTTNQTEENQIQSKKARKRKEFHEDPN